MRFARSFGLRIPRTFVNALPQLRLPDVSPGAFRLLRRRHARRHARLAFFTVGVKRWRQT